MPHDEHGIEEPQTPSQKLTNDDFRKLLMTPRGSGSSSSHAPGSIREAMAKSRYIFFLMLLILNLSCALYEFHLFFNYPAT